MSGCSGIIGVYYREIRVFKTRLLRSVAASMVSPALFLIAFGYGLGRGQVYGGQHYLDFLFAGLLAMSTLNACYGVGTDINIARFYLRVFDEYLIAPVPRWQIVVGETLYGMTRGGINALLFFLYALVAGLHIRVTPLFLAALAMHMAVFSLLGFIVALSVKKHGDQFAINTFIITPMTFLSGIFFPVSEAPAVLRWLVQIFPVSHSVAAMRSALAGQAVNPLQMAALGLFLAALAWLAIRLAGRAQG